MTRSPSNAPRSPGATRRVARWAVANPVTALLVVAGVAAAAITISYTTASTLTTSVTAAPIQFAVGDDTGSLSDYVTQMSVSTNKTYLQTTIKGVPEATLSVGSFFKIQNVDDAPRTITLSTANVTNSLVTAYTIELYDGSNVLTDTIDLRSGTATVSASETIPAGATYTAKLTLSLGSGAGANNVALSNSLSLAIA